MIRFSDEAPGQSCQNAPATPKTTRTRKLQQTPGTPRGRPSKLQLPGIGHYNFIASTTAQSPDVTIQNTTTNDTAGGSPSSFRPRPADSASVAPSTTAQSPMSECPEWPATTSTNAIFSSTSGLFSSASEVFSSASEVFSSASEVFSSASEVFSSAFVVTCQI
ncbi:MAG: hypothetical protein J3R72DRAFT_421529 [Linnemannia gamsii]|nr:MAG: hypothetical protein J3R72DRAFT_421529 [Linnemannia gamsii]